MLVSEYNLSSLLEGKKDSHAKQQGDFILGDTVHLIGGHAETWEFMRNLGGRMVRLIYECKDGTRRDIIGRQGVYQSKQDGTVKGLGHAMTSEARLTLSFHTHTYGNKVNTGSGKGYRTLRAAGILAIRVDGEDILTAQGQAEIKEILLGI